MKTTAKDRVSDLAALFVAGTALVAILCKFVHAVTGLAEGYFLMLIGFPVMIAGVLLAFRFRSDIHAHPWHLIAGAGAGAAGFYLMMLPDQLGVNEHLLGPSSSWGTFLLGTVIWLLFFSYVWWFVPWLYRHALSALTFRRRDQLASARNASLTRR